MLLFKFWIFLSALTPIVSRFIVIKAGSYFIVFIFLYWPEQQFNVQPKPVFDLCFFIWAEARTAFLFFYFLCGL